MIDTLYEIGLNVNPICYNIRLCALLLEKWCSSVGVYYYLPRYDIPRTKHQDSAFKRQVALNNNNTFSALSITLCKQPQ